MGSFVGGQMALSAPRGEPVQFHPGASAASAGLLPEWMAHNHQQPGAGSAAAGSANRSWPAALGLSAAVSLPLAVRNHRRRGKRAGKLITLRAVAVSKPVTDPVEILKSIGGGLLEREDIRNLAIIAHVDHGKTTLTDKLMMQTGKTTKSSMDSNALEAERGITILAKNAAIRYKGVKINLIDTPGHADFGGEVERILNMADGCLLLVDAQEGPMPQTKFVLRKALELQKRVLVVINKVDKPSARPDYVLDATFDLFSSLGASDELCDFPVCYASGIKGMAAVDGPDELQATLTPLLDQILEECPKPKIVEGQPLQMLVANLDYDDYIGRICIGRISSGSLKVGQMVGFQYGEGATVRVAKISQLWQFNNNERIEATEIKAGDICAFSGMDDVVIGDTIVDPANPLALPPIVVEEPTVVMQFSVNTSPLCGKNKASTKLTSSELEKRLKKECMINLAIRVEPGLVSESFKVKGRGTLQLGILMENMRREGFEMMVGAPQVIYRQDPETGKKQEPYEESVVEVPTEYQGVVMDEYQKKGAMMMSMEPGSVENSVILKWELPTANLIGMQGKMLSRTRGQAVVNSRFSHWGDVQTGEIKLREKGSIVTMAGGIATSYSLLKVQARGTTFINPGDEVYAGMCIGIHNKDNDLEVNITHAKAVNNTRAGGMGGPSISLCAEAIAMTIDDFLGHMEVDEMLEVTPGPLRLCKQNAKGLKVR